MKIADKILNDDEFDSFDAKIDTIIDLARELETELAAVTEQRDRLAEALQKAKAVYTPSSKGEYQTGWHDAICWVNQQALQSLNQNAGGMARELAAQDSDNTTDING